MAWLAAVLVLTLAGVGSTDPIRARHNRERIWHGTTPELRDTAIQELATLATRGNASAIHEATILVLSDEPKVRIPLIRALIANEVLSRATAAHVPTASALTAQLGALLASRKLPAVPDARDCRVTGGTARFATIDCEITICRSGCMNEITTLTVTTGKRWRIAEFQQSRIDDGDCGLCMLVD